MSGFEFLCGALLAQADGGAADTSSVAVQSVWDFIVKGGVMMIPIGVCSLVALAVIVERALSLRRANVIPNGFVDSLKPQLSTSRNAAREYCEKNASPIATIFAAAIRRLDEPLEVLERHIEQSGQREIMKLRKNLRVLMVIAAICPLLGLLGTIFGMIRAFQTVATSPDALGRTEKLAQGIYQAMITTAAGLCVTIPVLIGYHWISAKVDRLVTEMDAMTCDFVEDARGPQVTKHARADADLTAGGNGEPARAKSRVIETAAAE